MLKRNSWIAILTLSSALLAGNAWAGYSLDRVIVTMKPGEIVQSLSVKADPGTDPVLLQIVPTYCTAGKDDKNDNCIPTKDLIIAPPFLNLKPGTTQLLRVGLRKPPNQQVETMYRLAVNEVSPHKHSIGIDFRIDLSVPIYVQPAHPAYGALMSLKRVNADSFLLSIHNTGNVHLNIVGIFTADKSKKLSKSPVFVWPQQTKTIPIKIPGLSDKQVTLTLDSNAPDRMTQTIAISP